MALSASSAISSAVPPDAFAAEAPSSRRQYAGQPSNAGDHLRSPHSPASNTKSSSVHGRTSQPETPQTQQRSPNSTVNSSGSNSTARPSVAHASPQTPTGANPSQAPKYTQSGVYSGHGELPVALPPRTSSSRPMTNPGDRNNHLNSDKARTQDTDHRHYLEHNIARESNMEVLGTGGHDHRGTAASPSGAREMNRSVFGSGDTSRTNSGVIAREIITDPQVDAVREKERLIEAVPAGGSTTKATAQALDEETATGSANPKRRSRQDFSASASKRKETRFGEYILGQTLGEGEFGKVKLGWKKDGSIEVAIKLLRRENLNTNPSRIPKIYREINILRSLSHRNIVGLHEVVETERYIGIIMEYASGGELFDYILTHRYLKDAAARRLFAQLISGVGYLHKKGIVHRDLKLENLLLDRNRNIIITDFGFANKFDPRDVLSEDIEFNLANRDFVKKMDLEKVVNGYRRGDLMQTSCGSPCYAAPELVVTDSLYTGRKVDVWSCGVILYAMLAGYLPFDDDPANPEGDNINLLYKYIVSTPLTFPEYVSPHARDLLRRILVPDPRKRADLFEVARHSWLNEYAHLVSEITSTTTTLSDIDTNAAARDRSEAPMLNRSASVREPSKSNTNVSAVGGLSHTGKPDDQLDKSKATRESKRRTVQVEYVAPQTQTVRGELSPPLSQGESPLHSPEKSAALVAHEASADRAKVSPGGSTTRKPLPQDPPGAEDARKAAAVSTASRPAASQGQIDGSKSSRDPQRSGSDAVGPYGQAGSSLARPNTGGSISSTGRLPSRGNSYSLPLAPTVAATNAQGRLAQPKGNRPYNISAPIPQPEPYISTDTTSNRPASQRVPAVRTNQTSMPSSSEVRGHRRASTLQNIFTKTGSFFGGKSTNQNTSEPTRLEKKYPPTSMTKPIPNTESPPRQSGDSRRPSFGFSRKNSDLSRKEKGRRFSLLPASFSFKSTGINPKDSDNKYPQDIKPPMSQPAYNTERASHDIQPNEALAHTNRHVSVPVPPKSAPHPNQGRYASSNYTSNVDWQSGEVYQSHSYADTGPMGSHASFQQAQQSSTYQPGLQDYDSESQSRPSVQNQRGARVLQKQNRKFVDAWDQDEPGQHSGSSGAARRVMDFFRRRGKARYGDEK